MPENFRSSFHGFNREDVVHYLDYLNKKHDEMLRQLSSEADNLRQKLENAMQNPPEDTNALKERCDQLEKELADAQSEKAALEGQASELQEKLTQAQEALDRALADLQAAQTENQTLENRLSALQAELDGVQAARCQEQTARKEEGSSAGAFREEELEAYRRAERTERMARERADQVYRQVNGVLADATVKVEEAAGQLADISDRVMSQMDLLRSAVDGSKQALADAAAGLYDLKPTEE